MKPFRFPDSLVLIFALIVAAQLLSHVLPAGAYERRMTGEPGSERLRVDMEEAMISDTVIHGIAGLLTDLPAHFSAVGMLLVQSLCNFFIPSGSGQACVTMPVMAPLADLTGVSRQTAMPAFQFGDGFTNMIIPTNAVLMGMLALGRIPYQRWFRFVAPLLLKIYIVAIPAFIAAVWKGY